MYAKLEPVLTADLQARLQARDRQTYAGLLCVVAGLALTMFVAVVVARGMERRADQLNAMAAHLRKSVGDVRDAAAAVQTAVAPVAGGGDAGRLGETSKEIGRVMMR